MLITTKFVQSTEDALLIGHPGTGKSHIAKAVAHAAIQDGYSVAYREAQLFFEHLFEDSQTGRRKKISKFFCESDLLVIDDLFLKKRLPETAPDDLLDVILERYRRRKSTLITSNRPIEEWGKLLNDNAAASAILDRLLHRGHLLKFEGKSYRLKEASKRLALSKKKI
ncbi:ATP-binding protein [Thermodesulfobacteriota bacterium]